MRTFTSRDFRFTPAEDCREEFALFEARQRRPPRSAPTCQKCEFPIRDGCEGCGVCANERRILAELKARAADGCSESKDALKTIGGKPAGWKDPARFTHHGKRATA